MSAALTPAEVERLARLLGMCGSDHADAAVAGRMADKLVREKGLTWEQVLRPPPTPPPSSPPHAARAPLWSTRERASWCLDHLDHVTTWEIRFCGSLLRQRRYSPKQKRCMGRIYDRVRAEVGHAR